MKVLPHSSHFGSISSVMPLLARPVVHCQKGLRARAYRRVSYQRTVSFSFGAETRRDVASNFGLGRSQKRVWRQAKSTPTSSRASERPHGQANSMTAPTV